MDSIEIAKVREYLQSARAAPAERALSFLIDSIARIISHLESEQRHTVSSNKTMIEVKESQLRVEKAVFGYRDDKNDWHPGVVDVVHQSQERSEKNGKLLIKLVLTVLGGLAIQLIHWLASAVKFNF